MESNAESIPEGREKCLFSQRLLVLDSITDVSIIKFSGCVISGVH